MNRWKTVQKAVATSNRFVNVVDTKDAYQQWHEYLNKYSLFPGKKKKENQRHFLISMAIIIFLSVNAVRYIGLLFITNPKQFVMFGSVFYPLGKGGIVIYVAAAMSCLQALLYRIVFLWMEKCSPSPWNLLSDFHVVDLHRCKYSSSRMKVESRFHRKMYAVLWIVKYAVQSTNICSDMITLITTLMAISKERDYVLPWLLWNFNQWLVTYTATDMTIVCGVWYVSNCSLKHQVTELLKLLDAMAEGKAVAVRLLLSNYARISRNIDHFNKSSKMILLILTVCSTSLNASIVYGTMITHQIGFIVISITLTCQVLFLLEAATALSKKGQLVNQKLHNLLIARSSSLSVRDKKLIMELMENSLETICLRDINDEPLTPLSFVNYVTDSIFFFLMFVEFIEAYVHSVNP